MNRAGGRRDETTSASFARVLGRYHLLEELSENSVGVLHLARLEGPKGFQRWSAVRRVHPHLANDAAFIKDFYDAARASASIQHPNVEATLDVGETEGTHWVALEYLHGERAAHLVSRAEIAETGVAWDVACRIVAQAALGLDAIHESQERRGPPFDLNHARLTPRQIFVSYEGETKILEACVPRRASATLSSDVMPYLSPEQMYGDNPDRRSDVFALGIILWEMCAGRRLFLGDDDDGTRELLERHDVPRLETKVRGLPRRVDEIIALALAVEPRHRFGTAIDLSHAIDEALHGESLVVTDYDAGRYMKALFADRFAAREERLKRAADATEIFTRASLPPSMAPSKAKPRPSIPPPSLPPKRLPSRASIPEAPQTTRDVQQRQRGLQDVHEVETVVGIASDPYMADVAPLSDSNEVYTAVMGENERAALIAEANPSVAKTDENEIMTSPQISGLDYDEDGENEPTIAQPPAADLTIPYPNPRKNQPSPDATMPMTERMPPPAQTQTRGDRSERYNDRRPGVARTQRMPQQEPSPMSTTDIGPPPVAGSRPPPAFQNVRREQNGDSGMSASFVDRPILERPASVEINATPPPMNAIDAQQAVSDGYLRIPAQQFPGASSYPPPAQPLPPTAQTYMISAKAPHELSTAAWLFALAIAVGGIAVIYESWSRSQSTTANPADSVTPATATIPTATGTSTSGSPGTMGTTVNPNDLPLSVTGVVPQTPVPRGRNGKPIRPKTHFTPPVPPPPQTTVDPQPPPAPLVAGGSGFLTVICTPACDDVLDGNTSLGPSPVFKAQVRSGTHRITLKLMDPPSTKVVSITVPTDDTAVVKQSMDGN